MCEDWSKIREELGEIGPFDINQALEPDFLRKCFSTLLVTTDNVKRRKLESGLRRLSSKSEIIFVLSKLIVEESDENVRLYAVSYLSNSTPHLVDAIMEAHSPGNKFEFLANLLFMGLSTFDFPNNLRSFLLNGLGTFMAKTFPDIWPDAIERAINREARYNPAYVFQTLAAFARVSRSLPINFHAKQEREAKMWAKFTLLIEPYTTGVLAEPTNVQIWENLALMLSEWIKMRDPLMNVIRLIVKNLIESGCFNPASLSTLITAFNELEYEMTESRMFLCVMLSNYVHSPLLDIIRGIIRGSAAGFEDAEANSVTELIHVIFEFYANIMNRSSRCFLFRFETTEQKTQHERILNQMFDFSAQVLELCYRHYDIANAIGVFYSTIQQTLVDDFYNIENFLAEVMLSKGQLSIPYVFEASTITNEVCFESPEYDEVLQFREIFLDLFLLLDALALKLNNELFSTKYAELLRKCVSERDFVRISAMACYLKDLPLNSTYIDIILELNLTWDDLNLPTLTDEQTIDFFHNYFKLVSVLSRNATYKQRYTGLIHETLRIAKSFLFDKTRSEGDVSTQFIIQNTANDDAYITQCFKLLNDFSSQMEFDEHFCQDIHSLCAFYYQKSQRREVVKLSVKSLADCVSFNGPNSKSIGMSFFEFICTNLHLLCSSLRESSNKREIHVKIKECVEDLATFCTSLSEKVISTIGPNLANIMWEAVLFLLREEIDCDVIYQLIDPFLVVITADVYSQFRLQIPTFVHKYPDLISRILKSSLDHPAEFLLSNVIPVIFDFVWAVFSVTMSTKEIQVGDQATLELLFVLFRRHIDVFLRYIRRLCTPEPTQNFINASIGISLKSITQSFADEGIVRGLRVLEVIVDTKNESVLACIRDANVHIIPAVLDLIFSVYFSCSQMSIAKLLFFYAHYSPQEFRNQLMSHRAGSMKGVDLVLAKEVTRALILKHVILWNDVWNREHTDD